MIQYNYEISEDLWNRNKRHPSLRKKTSRRKDCKKQLQDVERDSVLVEHRRALTERYGPWQTVYGRFCAWTKEGVWEKAFHALVAQDMVDGIIVLLDGMTVKVYQYGSGVKKGSCNVGMGRSQGGLTTKIHMATDGFGNHLHFLLSGGNRNDICMVEELPESFGLLGKIVFADKGYDSDKFVK